MKDYCYVVMSKPVSGQEQEYNRWYDHQHLADVLAVPGFVDARRYSAEVDGTTQYLAVYKLHTDDAQAALGEVHARAGSDRMPISPALDPASVSVSLFEALEPAPRGDA